MSRACRWRAVSSALSKCRQRSHFAHMQSLFKRSALGSVMQMFVATIVSDIRWFNCSPAQPKACSSCEPLQYSLSRPSSSSPQNHHLKARAPSNPRRVLISTSAVMAVRKAIIQPADAHQLVGDLKSSPIAADSSLRQACTQLPWYLSPSHKQYNWLYGPTRQRSHSNILHRGVIRQVWDPSRSFHPKL